MRTTALLALLLCSACGRPGGGTVRIALVANSFTHLPVALTESLGFYRQEGVEVVLEAFPSAQKTAEALLAGSADLATGGYDQLLQLTAGGRPVRSVFVTTSRDVRCLMVSPARNDIHTFGDLKGKTIGVPGLGSPNHLFTLHLFALHGLRAEEASFAGVGVGRTMVAALERGVVDAAVVTGVDVVRLRMRNPGITVLADASTPEGSKAVWGSESMPNAILFGHVQWIGANREKLLRVARAAKRTLAWLQAHSAEEILAVLPEEYRTEDAAVDLAGVRRMKPIYSIDGMMPPDAPETIRKALALTQKGIREANIDVSRTFTNEFAGAVRP